MRALHKKNLSRSKIKRIQLRQVASREEQRTVVADVMVELCIYVAPIVSLIHA